MIKVLKLHNDLKIKVYSNGQIETFDHKHLRGNGTLDNRKGKILKPFTNKYGYQNVTLTASGNRKTYLVHRLVAMAFLNNPYNKPTVNHIDGNKLNNHIDNLEWATHKEQKRHSMEMGLCTKNIEALASSNLKKSIPVYFRGSYYPSIKSAAKSNNVHERVVKRESEVMPNEQLA